MKKSSVPAPAGALVMCFALLSVILWAVPSPAEEVKADAKPKPTPCKTVALRPYFDMKATQAAARQDRIQKYLGVDPKKPIDVLVFDHGEQSWSACAWSPGSQALESMEKDLGRGPDGMPRLRRRSGDQFLLAVANTDPFLYTRDAAILPPVDAAGVANLKTLAGAIGALVPSLLSVLGGGPAAGKTGVEVIAQIPDLQQKMALFVQKLEYRKAGDPAEDPGFTPAEVDLVTSTALGAFDDLAKEHAKLSPTVKGCVAEWAVLTALLKRKPLMSDDVKAARTDFYKAGAPTPGACRVTTPRDYLEQLVSPPSGQTLADVQGRLLHDPDVTKATDAMNATRLLEIEDVLSQRKTVEAALAQLAGFVRIANRVALGVDGKSWDLQLLNAGVALMNPSFEAQRWDKDYPGTLTIKPDPSLCADCGRVRASLDKSAFTLTSRADSFLGVGFGVTYTSIKDPTFGKVSIDPTGQTKGLVIGRTSEESRAGLLVVLGILRPWPLIDPHHRRGPVEPGIEFGAGVDPKKPAGFLGLSLELWKVVRLGIGGTIQSVTTLDDGLTAASFGSNGVPVSGTGSPVSADGDLRTRKRATSRLYFSLVLGLDSLPFFEPKKGP